MLNQPSTSGSWYLSICTLSIHPTIVAFTQLLSGKIFKIILIQILLFQDYPRLSKMITGEESSQYNDCFQLWGAFVVCC